MSRTKKQAIGGAVVAALLALVIAGVIDTLIEVAERLDESLGASVASYSVPSAASSTIGLADLSAEAGGTDNPNNQPLDLMFFEGHGVNPFVDADEDSLSTFALDGDTASYEILSLYLDRSSLPPADAVRVEDFLNSLQQDYPTAEGALGLHLDAAPSPFGREGYVLLRVGVSNPAPPLEREPVSLIFVVDVSGSMELDGRLTVAVDVLTGIAGLMRAQDRAGLVIYGDNASVVRDFIPGNRPAELVNAARALRAGGSTYAEAGLRLAYDLAKNETERGRPVRIVLLSDGVGNVGTTGASEILDLVDRNALRQATLTAIGVGSSGNYNDVLLEALANRGNGTYHYVTDRAAAAAYIERSAMGVFTEGARDARIQVEFNPEAVRKYRLIGYENRAAADEDFRDDTLDFGEPGFARDVTALYEIRLEDGVAQDDVLATARLRWIDPVTSAALEVEADLAVSAIAAEIGNASPHFRQVAAVAEFAELLRMSFWAQCGSLEAVADLLNDVSDDLGNQQDHRTLVRRVASASEIFEPYCP